MSISFTLAPRQGAGPEVEVMYFATHVCKVKDATQAAERIRSSKDMFKKTSKQYKGIQTIIPTPKTDITPMQQFMGFALPSANVGALLGWRRPVER